MIATDTIGRVIGHDVYDASGDKIGQATEVYLDDVTGRPEWVTVKTGLFGTKESFVPIHEADLSGDGLRVPVGKDRVKDAPRIEADGHLSPQEESELYRYYGLGEYYGRGEGAAGPTDAPGTVGNDTSGPTTDDAMTRSEERLDVGTRQEEVGRARLRKYVVTENVTQTVPVSHEEVRVEREPITDANVDAATDGPAISEEEHEVTLRAERPVVQKEAVPVERVRLSKETVSGQEQVSADVRQERIDTEGAVEGGMGEADRRRATGGRRG